MMARNNANRFLNWVLAMGFMVVGAAGAGVYYKSNLQKITKPTSIVRSVETAPVGELEKVVDEPAEQVVAPVVEPIVVEPEPVSRVNKAKEVERFEKVEYTLKELDEVGNILYAEAANQSRQNRRLIARTILNRVKSDKYPNSIEGVTRQTNAFSCTIGSGSKLWQQATRGADINEYELGVLADCGKDAEDVLEGKIEGIPQEDKVIAYHDTSIDKPNDDYWNSMVEVYRNQRLVFYRAKEITEVGDFKDYTVRPGDNYTKIAKREGTTVDVLKKYNPNIKPRNLQIGQKLKYREVRDE